MGIWLRSKIASFLDNVRNYFHRFCNFWGQRSVGCLPCGTRFCELVQQVLWTCRNVVLAGMFLTGVAADKFGNSLVATISYLLTISGVLGLAALQFFPYKD